MFQIKFPTKTQLAHMPISSKSGGRGLIIFGVVISLEVPFENDLKIHNFVVPFILVCQLLLQLLFTDPMNYMVQILGVSTFLHHSY